MRARVASIVATAVVRPFPTAPAISAAVRQAPMSSDLKHGRRLKLVRQIKRRHLLGKAPVYLQMGLYRSPPLRLDRQRQRARSRINKGIERPVLCFAHAQGPQQNSDAIGGDKRV